MFCRISASSTRAKVNTPACGEMSITGYPTTLSPDRPLEIFIKLGLQMVVGPELHFCEERASVALDIKSGVRVHMCSTGCLFDQVAYLPVASMSYIG
jgi:hypothetical protein